MNEDKIYKLLLGINKEIQKMKQDIGGMKQDIGGMKQEISGMRQDIGSINDELQRLGKIVAKIEVEHGEKIQILLDIVTDLPSEKEKLNKKIKNNEQRIQDNSDKIYYLNSKVHAF